MKVPFHNKLASWPIPQKVFSLLHLNIPLFLIFVQAFGVFYLFFFCFFWMQCVGFELVFSDVCLQNSSRSKRAKFLISCGLFGQSKTILYFNALCNTYIAYVTFWWVFLWLFLSVLSLPAIVRVLYILLFLINIVVFVIIRVSVDFDKEFSKLLPRS